MPRPTSAPASARRGRSRSTGIAAARFGDTVRLAAIGLTNEPRLLAPADPLAGLPGLEQTGWKRELAGVLLRARARPRRAAVLMMRADGSALRAVLRRRGDRRRHDRLGDRVLPHAARAPARRVREDARRGRALGRVGGHVPGALRPAGDHRHGEVGLRVPRRHEGAHRLPVGLLACPGYLVVAPAEREDGDARRPTRRCASAGWTSSCAASTASASSSRGSPPPISRSAPTSPTGGHAQPLFVADGFVRAAERDGATLRLGTRVTALRPDGQGWSLWLGDGTRASAEVVIVACGPWANKLTRGLGGVVPLALSRGQAGRFRPRHAFGGARADHLRPRPGALDQARGQRRPLPDRRPRRPPRPQPAPAPDGPGGSRRRDARDVRGRARAPLPGHGRRRLARLVVELLRLHARRQPGHRPDPRPPEPDHGDRACRATASSSRRRSASASSELVVDGAVRSFDWSVFAYGRFARRGDRVGGGRGPG